MCPPPPSRRSPHVELLNHCALTLYNGRAFPVLTEAQMLESFSLIKEDLQKIGLAYHLCELVDGLCPENQENKQVFHLVKSTLTTLAHSQNEYTALIHNFQIELLSLLGYMDKQHFLTQQMDSDSIGVDMDHFVETIIEKKLKSKRIFVTV